VRYVFASVSSIFANRTELNIDTYEATFVPQTRSLNIVIALWEITAYSPSKY